MRIRARLLGAQAVTHCGSDRIPRDRRFVLIAVVVTPVIAIIAILASIR
jgi:hypothetical protein